MEYRKALLLGQQHALTALAAVPAPLPLAAYLEPPDNDESLLRSLVNAVADERFPATSMLYMMAVHHIAAYLFRPNTKTDNWLRQEFCKTVLRSWSRKSNALTSLLDADANMGGSRADRLKLVETVLREEPDLRPAWEAILAARP